MIRKTRSGSERARKVTGLRRPRRAAPPPKRTPNPLEGVGHPHLAPRGWTVGRPLGSLLAQGPLPTSQSVAVTLAVLSALGALHRSGRTHGGVSESAVGIGADGWVRLAADAATETGRGPEGDVQDAGALLCRLLGVEASPEPQAAAAAAERAAPALVALGRRLARDAAGWPADEVWLAVKDAGGFWGAEPQLVEALGALAERAEGETPLERAVTRVLAGPPLRAEAPPTAAVPQTRPRIKAPRLTSGNRVLPPLPTKVVEVAPFSPSLPTLSLPSVARPPVRRLASSRFVQLAAGALAGGLLIGALAGGLASRQASARAAAARPGVHKPQPRPPARPAGLYVQSPAAAVSTFFQLVQERKLDEAALLWKSKMAASVDLTSRFSGVSSVNLKRDDVTAEDDRLGIATVAVDWVETAADGSTHEYAGVIYVDDGPIGWRWDSWRVTEVTAPAASTSGGGDGGGGGGGGGDGG